MVEKRIREQKGLQRGRNGKNQQLETQKTNVVKPGGGNPGGKIYKVKSALRKCVFHPPLEANGEK